MTTIQDFIGKVQDQAVSVSDLLRAAKILASKLDQKEFLVWVDLELNGYKDDSIYPDYRKMIGVMKVLNPFRGWIPVLFKDPEVERTMSTRETNQSISEIEELLASKSATYQMTYPTAIAEQILSTSSAKTSVSLFIDRSALAGVLNKVRNRLLDWALSLEKQGIKGDAAEFTTAEKKVAQGVQPTYNIGSIGSFSGNIGENKGPIGGAFVPKEGFWDKFFWYVLVALAVVIVGNVASAWIVKQFGI